MHDPVRLEESTNPFWVIKHKPTFLGAITINGEFDRLLYLFQFHSLLGFAFLLLFDFSIKDGFAKQTASIWFWVLVGFAVAPFSLSLSCFQCPTGVYRFLTLFFFRPLFYFLYSICMYFV